MDCKSEGTKAAQGSTIVNASVAELIALAASMAAGFTAGIEYHATQARKLGLSDEDLVVAANVGLKLRQAATEDAVRGARKLLAPNAEEGHEHGSCCGGGGCGDDDCK